MFTTFEIVLNPLYLFTIMLLSGFIGFMFKRRRISKDRAAINKYEKEMMLNHAEILDLQRDYINLEIKMRELTTPVIPFSNTTIKESAGSEAEKSIEAAKRKKLLSVDSPAKEKFNTGNVF